MAISTQAIPRHNEWKLILLLRKTSMGGTLLYQDALDMSGVAAAALPGTASYGWIEGVLNGRIVHLGDLDTASINAVGLRLTTDGRSWIDRSPACRILFAIHDLGGSRSVDLHTVSRRTGVVDGTWFTRLARGRSIQLQRSNGEPLDDPDHLGTIIHAGLRQRVQLTRQGLDLVTV